VLFAYLGFSQVVSAQYMEFEWSEEFRYTNRKTGFFTEYIGADLTTIYMLQRNIAKTKPYDKAKLMLVALTKNSLNEVEEGTLPLKGFPENKGQAETLESLDYVKAVLFEGKIVVFWRKLINTDSTRTEEIYAQTFKSDFKVGLPLKKVFEFVQEVDSHQSIFTPTMCVVLSNDDADRIVLGTENFSNGQLKFVYNSVSANLSSSAQNRILLPQKSDTIPGKMTSDYELGSNGNIHIRSTVLYTIDELWELPAKHAKTFPVLTVVNAKTNGFKSLKLQGENKTITDFSYHVTDESTRVLGFFGDVSKDTTGIDNQGLFYADLDISATDETVLNYVYFARSSLNQLFPKKRGRKKKGDLPSAEELLKTRFNIEHIAAMPDSSLVLFFTRQYNYKENTSKSDMNGENVYSSQPICKKSNVTAIRFSKDGEVMWTRNMVRNITYQGTDVSDIKVVEKYGKFIVLFGNELAELEPPRKGKKYQHLTSELEYATFSPETGRVKILSTPVNEPKTEKRDMHYLDPNTAVVFGNQFYFHKMKVRQNALWTVANVVCFPTIYYSVLTGNTKLGKGDFSMMRIMEGKRPRKKR
jgi:hypothetical protein